MKGLQIGSFATKFLTEKSSYPTAQSGRLLRLLYFAQGGLAVSPAVLVPTRLAANEYVSPVLVTLCFGLIGSKYAVNSRSMK